MTPTNSLGGLVPVARVSLIGIGIARTVRPPLPGPIVVFAGVLVAARWNGFTRIGASTVVLLVLVTTAAHVVDLASAAARQAF